MIRWLPIALVACGPAEVVGDTTTDTSSAEVDTGDDTGTPPDFEATCDGHFVQVEGWLGRPIRSCWEPVVVELRVDWWAGYCALANEELECTDAEVTWPTTQHTCFKVAVTCPDISPSSDPWIGDCEDAPGCCDPAIYESWGPCPAP